MRGLFKVLGSLVALFFIAVFGTLLFSFVTKVWFGMGDVSRKEHVAVLDLEGILITSTSFLRDLEDSLESKGTKAIVVRINSPGGVVAPSQEIYEALKEADKKVPVLISMGSLAASGGYYVSLGGRKVYSNPGTLTGSIGVIIEFVNTQKLYQWAKVERFALTAGRLKDAGSPWRPMNAEEKDYFQKILYNIHSQFKSQVKARRKLTDEEVEAVTDGRVFTGEQALKAKLVDSLGTFDDALKEAKKIAKLPDTAEVYYPEKHKGLLRKLWEGEPNEYFRGILKIFKSESPLDEILKPGWRIMFLAPVR